MWNVTLFIRSSKSCLQISHILLFLNNSVSYLWMKAKSLILITGQTTWSTNVGSQHWKDTYVSVWQGCNNNARSSQTEPTRCYCGSQLLCSINLTQTHHQCPNTTNAIGLNMLLQQNVLNIKVRNRRKLRKVNAANLRSYRQRHSLTTYRVTAETAVHPLKR